MFIKSFIITKDEFDKGISLNDNNTIYLSGMYENKERYYKKFVTDSMSNEEMSLALQLKRTKDISVIKGIVIFALVISILWVIIPLML